MVYHDIFFGPYKLKLEDVFTNLEQKISDTKYVNIDVPTYIPEITYANISDEANIDYGNINYNCKIQKNNNNVDFKMNISFFDINITGDENIFKINLPLDADLDLYETNTKSGHGNLVIHYNKLNETYLNSSSLSSCYLNKENKNELIVESGLFIMFNKDIFDTYYLNSAHFKVDIHVVYTTTKICL